ncbi:hypothetical protein PR202_ga00520 [Eleusine coracana subsp. coracana]|uniref:Complex III subunit 9 n=1 Tax=Eleusine coracana subsp. coracana TaxID=191504 RepID=A0AAV5BGG8_ELECO|nr:hypothetical protein PR202_ga00520 [Eleusine coracana subsp. coracana]
MGLADALYRVVMRRNAVYVTFVVAGAFAGERAVDYGVHKLWEMNNVGVRYFPPPHISSFVVRVQIMCLFYDP